MICAGRVSDDPTGLNYVFYGRVAGFTDLDYSATSINFSVRRYAKPGTFPVGAYPRGALDAPAIAVAARYIAPGKILTWTSGTGSVAIDAGARSGSLDLHLISTDTATPLAVAGSWSARPAPDPIAAIACGTLVWAPTAASSGGHLGRIRW